MEGQPFGQYRLLTLIGRGGMGEVWRAYDTNTDRVVALKVLPPHLADDEMFKKRFRREARVAAGLYEPHVVPIHGYGEIDGHLYVDMRLIVGEDLETLLSRGPLDPARAVWIVDQVASALQAAHDEGLIHRDVKPSNILVTASDFAYLIDFGIARTAGSTGLTNTGSTIGTWAYMAPERFGVGEPDPRSDVYALACVLHQALTGRQPFPGDSVEQQVAAHLSSPPPRPSILTDGVPHAFDDVIATGLAKDVDQRYSTTGQLAAAARAAVDDPRPTAPTMPVHAPGPTQLAPPQVPPASGPPIGSARTPWWRRPARVIPAAVGAIAVAVVSTVLLVQSGEKDADALTAATGPTTAPAPAGPSFDGTFTVSWGAPTQLNGKPQESSLFASETWVVRSYCDRSGCVASSTTVDRAEGVRTFSFDYVDGSWIAVSEQAEDGCKNETSQLWRTFTLQTQPDGSLTGEQLTMVANGCNSRFPVTFTRIGDADPGVQVSDPALLPPRVQSPAQGFRGRYHHASIFSPENASSNAEGELTFVTACLRTGDRCMSFGYRPGGILALAFANNEWVSDHESDAASCTNKAPAHVVHHVVYPLPQPAPDPLPTLTGTGQVNYSGGCTGVDEYTVTFTRTGD